MRWVLFALVSGCAGAPNEPVEPAESSSHEQSAASTPPPAKGHVANAAPEQVTSKHHAELVASVAREYKGWQLADDEFHWAPGLCRMPVRGGQHLSKANGAAHDGKVFVLWTADINRYGRAVGWLKSDRPDTLLTKPIAPPPGMLQALVKESFVAKEFHAGDELGPHANLHGASKDGKPLAPGDPIGLFVMIELEGKPAGTDEGWIYGTVAPDGTVTSASDVGACHDCHSTRDNRLFGLGKTRPG